MPADSAHAAGPLLSLISGTPTPAELAALADPALWNALTAVAHRHGLNPLLAHAVREYVPPEARDWCDKVLLRSWTRYNQNLAELDRTLDILDRDGIETLVLKGALLARRHYRPPFLRRPSFDIDLGVRTRDLQRACASLARAGYAPDWPLREAIARAHHVELSHSSPTHSSAPRALPHLELHFRLSHGRFGLPIDEFFDRAVTDSLPGGRSVRILSSVDEILHLVLHRAHGRFATLFHLEEIRRIWQAAPLAVREETIRRAVDRHFVGVIAFTDVAFRSIWGVPFLPSGVTLPPTWLAARIDRPLFERFEALSEPGRSLPLSARLGRRWIDFQLTDRPQDALRFADVLTRVAWLQLRRRGWRTVRQPKANPCEPDPNPCEPDPNPSA